MTYTAFPAFKLYEVTTDHLEVPLGGATGMVFMTQARYDALSDEAKAALDAHSGCETSREMGKIVVQWEADSRDIGAANGEVINTIAREEFLAAREKLSETVFGSFAERVDGGQELLDAYSAAMAAAMEKIGE